MTRLSWALLGLMPLAVVAACGGGDDRPKIGSGGSGHGGDATGGKSSGGSGNRGGDGTGGETLEDGGFVDRAPPAFAGATKVEAVAQDRVRVSWDAASDDHTPAERLGYYVYRSTESGAQDFTRARRCATPDADLTAIEQASLPCFTAAGAGETSSVVRDIIPSHPYYFVVRAVDEAGNEDDNTAEVNAQTDDTTGPEFGGVRTVKVLTATSLEVGWGPGYDLASGDSQLQFRVYAAAGKNPDPDKDDALVTSRPGEHVVTLPGLDPLTPYKVLVRAVDPTGNEDANTRVLGATTPEGVAPTFNGVSRVLEQGLDANGKARVRVFWPPASDNITDVANIVYDVYQATRTHQQKFTTPTYTSAIGSSSLLVTGLEPGTRYYYVVRARDVAGNEDDNQKEVSVVTRPLDQTPPTFSGAGTVTIVTPRSLRLTWSQANDAVTTSPSGFTYLVYRSTDTPVDTTTPPFMTLQGVTAAQITGLAPATAYHFVVRAKDQAGNVSPAGAEVAGTTPAADAGDVIAPVLTGDPTVTLVVAQPTQLTVAVPAATDASGANNIRYVVCASAMTQTDCDAADFSAHVVGASAFGETSIVATGLTPRTDYYVFVRAEDRAGNMEAGTHFKLSPTPTSFRENVAPILVTRCGACHDYSLAASLVNRISQINWPCPGGGVNGCQLDLAEPGRPELSAIYRKINPPNLTSTPFSAQIPNEYSGLQEPRDTTDKLSGLEDDTIRTWIVQGASGN